MKIGALMRKIQKRMRVGSASYERIKVTAIFGTVVAVKDDLVTRQIIDFGAHTRPELAFLLSVINPGDKVFDIGAHIGTFAIPIARKVGSVGRVLAVEGEAFNFALLVENITENGLTHVITAWHGLIAPPASSFKPEYVQDNSGATFFRPQKGPRVIPQYTIDELSSKTFQPDVIKIDIEGMEAWAIADSLMIVEKKPILYAEVCKPWLARYGATIDDLDRVLRRLGYRLFRNEAPRNAPNDDFLVRELQTLAEGGDRLFDVLAIPNGSPRLERLR